MYSVCNRTWFKTSNCPHFTHFILFQMALNLIKIPFSGTSPAFGKGPSQSDSPRTAALTGLGQDFLSLDTHAHFTSSHLCFAAALALPGCGQWNPPLHDPAHCSAPRQTTLKRASFEHLSCNTNQCYWASWMHFSKTTSLSRIHHKTRKEMEEPDSAKCSSWGSSGKPWTFIFLQLLP